MTRADRRPFAVDGLFQFVDQHRVAGWAEIDHCSVCPVAGDVFVGVNFAIIDLGKRCVELLNFFRIPTSSVGIYIRSDRPTRCQ